MTNAKGRAEINVTPLIDVLLVLLIIFLLITPQLSHGLDARIPQPSSQGGDGRDVIVRIGPDRGLTIDTEPVGWDELGDRFLEIYARRAEKVLFIDAAPGIEFNDVARVLDTAKGADIRFVAFLPKDSKRLK